MGERFFSRALLSSTAPGQAEGSAGFAAVLQLAVYGIHLTCWLLS
jgi:hypothetical protein